MAPGVRREAEQHRPQGEPLEGAGCRSVARQHETHRRRCGERTGGQQGSPQAWPVHAHPAAEEQQRQRLRDEQRRRGERVQRGVLVERRQPRGVRAQSRHHEQRGHPRPERPREQQRTAGEGEAVADEGAVHHLVAR
ncbi:MAG TPA: hypothetical protein VLA70_16075 [Nocardioides sp.]|nr:hypothetical protein [Nocardioides sp.]